MIDMTFTFLIFFLVATRFERAEGVLASELPALQPLPVVPLPLSPLVVRLVQTGPEHDDFSLSVEGFPEGPRDLAELPEFVRRVHQQPGFGDQTPLVIVADADVRWDHVVGCWNAALRAGFKRVAFGQP